MIVHEERGGSSPSSRRLWAPFGHNFGVEKDGDLMENDFGPETPSISIGFHPFPSISPMYHNGIIYQNGINHNGLTACFWGFSTCPKFSTVVAPRIRCSVTGRLEGCHCPDRGEHQGAVWWRGWAMWPGLARGTFQETSQHPTQGIFDGFWW